MHLLADFLRSEQGRCLQNQGTGDDMMPDDNSVDTPSFDDQCKFAYGRDYTKYNGRYQGITLQKQIRTMNIKKCILYMIICSTWAYISFSSCTNWLNSSFRSNNNGRNALPSALLLGWCNASLENTTWCSGFAWNSLWPW